MVKDLVFQPSKKDMAEMKRLTTSNIAFRILQIMTKHIGTDNEISHMNMFKQIFGRAETPSLADELRWNYVKKAMHLCRQKTKCFIGSRYYMGTYRYFVIKSMNDASYYVNTLDKSIKRMHAMKKKAVMSVKQRWSSTNWIDEVQEKKQLGHVKKLR